jgi:hypothetical protein
MGGEPGSEQGGYQNHGNEQNPELEKVVPAEFSG